ncbi:MAG: WbuC family cupin fold metalloprotein [Leptospiraceae bacterium]|nr:WbuC family cupin fold metalloprotein [Leptospiraceae bacterium]
MQAGKAVIQLIDQDLIDQTALRAAQSERQRMNYNLHGSLQDGVHRFLNIIQKGSYIQPHRHLDPPKHESFVALEGQLAFFAFHDDGRLQNSWILDGSESSALRGIDIPAGIWHTIAALSERCVCFEVKPGPWEPGTDKQFASWAPAEGSPAATPYLEKLLRNLH